MPINQMRKGLIRKLYRIPVLVLATVILTACQQQSNLVKPGPKPFSFNQMMAYTIGVLPATGKKRSLNNCTALLYANSLNRALVDQYGDQLTLITPDQLAKTIGHYQPHQQHLSTFLSENGFIPARQLQQLELIYPHLRYLFVITILQNRIRYDQRIHRARYFQHNGNPLDQKRNWFATYLTIRELTAKIRIYDLVEQKMVWSNDASIARTTVKNYHQVIAKNETNPHIEEGKHYPKPISSNDIARDLFGQMIAQLPQ